MMQFREASAGDIPQIQEVRRSVKENRLSDPSLVTDDDCLDHLTRRGKGWVCEAAGVVVAFAIADLQDHNIWALFVRPAFEQKGIGKTLHHLMVDWYFSQTKKNLWLSTATGSRAEEFYRRLGWQEAGIYRNGEIKFVMPYRRWQKIFRRMRSG